MKQESSKRITNPYVAGNAVGGGDAFVGRADILQEVLNTLNDPNQKAIVLFGQRRIGKTSILRQLEVDLPQQGSYQLVFFDLLGKAYQPLVDTLSELANKISDAMAVENPTLANIANFHQQWLSDVLSRMNKDSCLVLLLDEFDALEDAASRRVGENFFCYLRDHLLTLHPHLKFIFAIGRNIGDLRNMAMSLFKDIHTERVSLFSKEDTEKVIRLSERDHTLTWSPEAVETIWQLTNGHPYLTQMLCWQIWATLREESALQIPQVTASNVNQKVVKTLEASHSALQWLWMGLPPSEKIITSIIATANHPCQEQELASLLQQNNIRLPESLSTVRLSLEKWDLIEKKPVDDKYNIRVELIRQWVAKNEPLAQVQTEIDRVNPQADAVYKSALAFYQGDDYDNALNDVHRALRLNPEHVLANQLLATILTEQNKWEEARQHLEEFYRYQPGFASNQLLHVLLTLANQSGNENAKLPFYGKILEIDGEHPEAKQWWQTYWERRGDKASQLGQVEEAKDCYQQAGRNDKVAEMWERQGEEIYQQGHLAEALAIYQEALNLYRKIGMPGKVTEVIGKIAEIKGQMGGDDETTATRQRVQGLMIFLGALADGLESVAGRGADAVCFQAGKKVGLQRQVKRPETDPVATVEAVKQEMVDMGINWPCEIYKRQSESDYLVQRDDHQELQLPFQNCIVRCTLFHYGFPQGKALCQTKHGLFCGLFEKISGVKRTFLGIDHAGENACLLRLKISN